MSRKTIKGFSELRTHWKNTETEAEAKALIKSGGFHSRKSPKLPKRPIPPPVKNRPMSDNDKFIVETLTLQLDCLPLDQLYDARLTILDAIETVSDSKISIQDQIESNEDHLDDQGRSWKARAQAALRFKIQEGQALKKKIAAIDELIARKKPPLKLVTPEPPPSSPPKPYEIRTDVQRPSIRKSSSEWSKYPFDQLVTEQQCFYFEPGFDADEVRRLVTAAQRHLNRRFSYRTEDGVISIWLAVGPPIVRKKKP